MSSCGFCGKENSDEISLTDGETQREILICADCDELRFFSIPKRVKEEVKGYKELTIQELDRKIDEMIDCEIERIKIERN